MDEPMPRLTAFTPAASCGQVLSMSSLLYENGNREFLRMDYGAPDIFMSHCFPPEFKTDTYHGGGYLPGPGICPSGYNTGCSSKLQNGPDVTSLSMCCPSGYICDGDIFDAWCYSHFTTTTTAWVGDPETYTITGVATPEYPEDYPHTVWAPAIVFTETAKQTGVPITASEPAPAWSFGVTAPTTTDGVSSTSITKFKFGITAAMCAIVLITSFVAGCLFIHFRKRQTRQRADQQVSKNPSLSEKPHPVSRPKWNFLFAILLVFPVAIFSCIFASQRDWQERLVQWTRDTSAVLRVIQVTSFFMRLFSTSLAWGVMSDCGWLLMYSGASAIEVISLLNMSVIGGNYV